MVLRVAWIALGAALVVSVAAGAQIRISLVPERELLTNGSFEDWPFGERLPAAWAVLPDWRESRVERSRDAAYGLFSVRLDGGVGVGVKICQTASAGVRGGAKYQVGFAAKATCCTHGLNLRLVLTWLDASGAEIGARSIVYNETGVVEYRVFSLSLTSPAGAVAARYSLQNLAGTDALVDNTFLRVFGD